MCVEYQSVEYFEQVNWFFSEDDLDDLSRLSVNLNLPVDSCEVEPPNTNHSLLLNNIQKIEGISYHSIIIFFFLYFFYHFYIPYSRMFPKLTVEVYYIYNLYF